MTDAVAPANDKTNVLVMAMILIVFIDCLGLRLEPGSFGQLLIECGFHLRLLFRANLLRSNDCEDGNGRPADDEKKEQQNRHRLANAFAPTERAE